MSREIKFRAFHKANNEMVYFDPEKAVNDQYQSSAMCRLMAGDDSGYLMQYTGLKDKNGVEIYEGDIVKEETAWASERNLSVEYEQGRYSLRDNAGFGHWLYEVLKDCDYGFKVIGNIYENPDLL